MFYEDSSNSTSIPYGTETEPFDVFPTEVYDGGSHQQNKENEQEEEYYKTYKPPKAAN